MGIWTHAEVNIHANVPETFWKLSSFCFENHEIGHVSPGLSQTLWICARHWDVGNGWPIKVYSRSVLAHILVLFAYIYNMKIRICVCEIRRHISAEKNAMCACIHIYIYCVYTHENHAHISPRPLIWPTTAWSQDNDAFDQMIYVDSSLHETFNKLLEVTYREKATQDTMGTRQAPSSIACKRPQVG